MKYIAYLEDDYNIWFFAKEELTKEFPDYQVLVSPSSTRFFAEIKSKSINVNDISIICTDGDLVDDKGWNIVEQLKEMGYKGPAIYTGFSLIPRNKVNLYNERTEKNGKELIDTIKKYINQ